MDQSSGGGGGEVAAKRPNLSSSGEDCLSALPDDIIVLILLRLDTITEAAQTSVLSRRWRRIWTLLPELAFRLAADDRHICEVLSSSEAPALHKIHIVTEEDSPGYVAAWLPLAARRLSGDLLYRNIAEEAAEEEVDCAIPLPCFGNATAIELDLGFLALALPSSGDFTRLTELCLDRVRFQGTCELGEVISAPRCPCLRNLSLRNTRGLVSLALCSDSLLRMDLYRTDGLLQLKINASALKELTVHRCFVRNQPVADISAPQLVSLQWRDVYDPSTVEFGNLGQLQQLGTCFFLVYGNHGNRFNRNFLWFLQRFQLIHSVSIILYYAQEISNFQYLMDDITHFPHVTFLTMCILNGEHAFGPCSFNVLRLCTGIRRLSINLHTSRDLEAQSPCQSGCICDQRTNWKIEELSLNRLQEVEITQLRGAEHEVDFLNQLFNWAVVLEKLKISFSRCVSRSKAKEFCQRLSRISRPESPMVFCMYCNSDWWSVELLFLEDEGTGL